MRDLQQIEHLIVRLLTQKYLQEEYHETAYCRVVYVAPGPLAARLNHHTLQSIKGEVKLKLEFLFPSSEIKSGTKRKNEDSSQPSGPKKPKVSAKSNKTKGKLKAVKPDDRDGDEDEFPNVLPQVEDISFLSDNEAPSHKILHKYVPDDFLSSEIKSGTKRKDEGSSQPSGSKKPKVPAKSSKVMGKLKAVEPDDRDGDEDEPANVFPEVGDISFLSDDEAPLHKILHKYVPDDDDYESFDLKHSDDNDDSTNNYAWSHSFLEEPRARFKPYLKNQTKASNRSTMNKIQEDEVITLSSD